MNTAQPGNDATPVVATHGLVVRRAGRVMFLVAAMMACVQVTTVLVISLTWLGVSLPGSAVPMAVVAVLDAVLGMACGLFASAFARTDAMQRIASTSSWTAAISADVAVILAFTVAALVGGALTLRRRTA